MIITVILCFIHIFHCFEKQRYTIPLKYTIFAYTIGAHYHEKLISNSANPEEKISKYQTADLLGVNHKTIDYYVRKGYIPHGRQEVGFKEIF